MADRCTHSFPDPYPQPMSQPGDCRNCGISYHEAKDAAAMTTAADEFAAAEERVRMGDPRIDVALRGPLRAWLDAMAEWARAYPEMAHDHDRPACDDYACDAMGEALAVARLINTGSQT